MRNSIQFPFVASLALLTLVGCVPAADQDSLLDQILGDGPALAINPTDSDTAPTGAATGATTISGQVGGDGDFQVHSYGASDAGDSWRIESAGSQGGFIVALFDAEMNLLARTSSVASAPLEHVLRRPTDNLFVGVAAGYGTNGGDYRFKVSRRAGTNIPGPNAQLVYLNFDGGQDVRVHGRPGVSFGAFDGLLLGQAYSGQELVIRQAILDTMILDYRGYDIQVVTSDQAPEPVEEHSTIHFGGMDTGLLGLADNVDRYNEDTTQSAIIYVESFAPFSTMRLTAEEIGLMIGNVSSHELGHLLGLYHTQNPDDVMDTTGSAWDLADDQQFFRVRLDESVFPTGMENAPILLGDSIGAIALDALLDLPPKTAKNGLRRAARQWAKEEMRWSCGLCVEKGL